MAAVIPWAIAAVAKAAIAVGVPTAVAKVAGALVVRTALSAALSVGAQMLMQPSVDRAGSPTQWRANPDQPAPVLTGRMKIAGDIIKRGGFGSQNMYQGIVGIVSGVGPVQGPVSWSVDRQPVTFGPDQMAVAPWGDKLWLSYQLGAQPEPAALASPDDLRGGADLPGWTSDHRLSSWAAYMVTLGHDSKQKVWPRGEPEFAGLWDGVLDWDPRQDSTWPGGSGTQRRDDPETWGPHENPILWGLRWARGHWAGVNGGVPHIDKLVAGMGMADDQIDIDSFVQCANLNDGLGWTCAARPTTADDKWQVLCAYLQAGGCYPDTIAGRLTCLARVGPKVSLATLDRSDLLGGIESVRSPRRLVRRNTVHPRYRSPDHDWDMVTANPVSRDVYVSGDGGRTRSKVIDYPYVTQLNQAAVLACYDVADSREGFNGGAAVKAWVKSFPPGSCVDMPDHETLGSLSGQTVMIRSVEVDLMTGGVAIGFAGETASKHSWALAGTTTVAPPVPFTPPSLTFPAPDVADWTATAGTGATPSVVLTGEVSNPLADAVLVEVRLDGTSDWSPGVQTDQTNLHRIETPVPGPGDWIAAVSYRSAETGIWGDRLELAPVTVGGVVIDWTDQPPPDPGVTDGWDLARRTGGGLLDDLGALDPAADAKLAGIEAGATVGADFTTNLENVPPNLAALSGSEVLDNATLQAALESGSVIPAEADSLTGEGPLAKSALSEAQVQGRARGYYAGGVAAYEADDPLDGDTWVDGGVFPPRGMMRVGGVNLPIQPTGIQPGVNTNFDIAGTGTTMTTLWSFTLPYPVLVTSFFAVQMGLEVQTSPAQTRSSSSSQAPGGPWEVWECPPGGDHTSQGARIILSGTFTSDIVGGGPNAAHITDFNNASLGDGWSKLGDQYRFKFGGAETFVVRGHQNGGPDLRDARAELAVFVQRNN